MRCKQLLLWACLIAAAQMGLEKARAMAVTHSCRSPASAASSRREASNGAATCARSENCEKRSSRGESSLRLCGFALSCELDSAPGLAQGLENASPAHLATRHAPRAAAGSSRIEEPCTQSLPSWLQKLKAWCMGAGG